MCKQLKDRLVRGEAVLGTFISLVDNPDVLRILQVAGFDYVVIDNEHGYMDYSKTAAMIGLANAIGMAALVRIPEARREVVLKYLEMGASGLMMPCCDTPEQAKELVEYAKYAPLGNRGVALFRAHTGYRDLPSGLGYMQDANDATLLIGQVESAESVANVGAILDVDGIDGVFVGPNDLSQALGIFGQMDNPVLLQAIEKVLAAAKARPGRVAGIFHGGAPEGLKKWIEKGMQLNLWASDSTMIMNQAKQTVRLVNG